MAAAVPGSLGDLRRATLGEGETEPTKIGEGTQDSSEWHLFAGTEPHLHITPLARFERSVWIQDSIRTVHGMQRVEQDGDSGVVQCLPVDPLREQERNIGQGCRMGQARLEAGGHESPYKHEFSLEITHRSIIPLYSRDHGPTPVGRRPGGVICRQRGNLDRFLIP